MLFVSVWFMLPVPLAEPVPVKPVGSERVQLKDVPLVALVAV